MNPIIKNLEAEYTTRELPVMNPGDTVRVSVKIVALFWLSLYFLYCCKKIQAEFIIR